MDLIGVAVIRLKNMKKSGQIEQTTLFILQSLCKVCQSTDSSHHQFPNSHHHPSDQSTLNLLPQTSSSTMGHSTSTANGNTTPKVLIVGAGPTGLVLATELHRRNVPLRIIDKLPSPLTTSRAFTVHSRTLEALDVMGLSQELIENGGGVQATSMQYHFVPGEGKDIKKTLMLEFGPDVVRGRHSGIVTCPQTVTERVLREGFEKIGGVIEWGCEMVGFCEKDDGGVEVEFKDGKKEMFEFMVGCDGARSSVRKLQNLEFAGLQYGGMTLKMMDVSLGDTLDKKFDREGYHYLIKEKSMLLLAKMGDVADYKDDKDVWRVLLSTQEIEPDISVEAFQKGVDRVLDGVKLGKPHWTVAYKIHKRMVTEYISEAGKVLLAGDSAHINSPAGGQGMNTAIQDGFNLGWKLALVCKGLAKEEILKTYGEERKPVAAKVLEGTDLLHSVMMAHGKKLTDRIEKASSEHWLEKAVLRISGQAFSYGDNKHEDLIGNDVVVADGDQAPDILVVSSSPKKPERLTTCAAPYYILVVFDEAHVETASKLKDKYNKVLTVVQAASVDSESTENGSKVPSDAVLKSQYGDCAAALIRPDRYVAAIIKEPVDIEEKVSKAFSALV